jgi:hypothetical protein
MAKSTTEFHRGGLLAISAAVLIVTFAMGFALGHGLQASQPSPAAATTQSACNWGAFPVYPNASAVSSQAGAGLTYRAKASVAQVARFYMGGANQSTWTFTPTSQKASAVVFRVGGSDGCRGVLSVRADAAGGATIQAAADANSNSNSND